MIEENKSSENEKIESKEICCDDESCCAPPSPIVRITPKIGRNEPCPCESGRKYKKCCGQYL